MGKEEIMKESQDRLKAKTLILTHGDSDGICSGAIAKTAYPDAYVYFTSPVNLLAKLSLIESVETLIICDIALDEGHSSELYPALIDFAKKSAIFITLTTILFLIIMGKKTGFSMILRPAPPS